MGNNKSKENQEPKAPEALPQPSILQPEVQIPQTTRSSTIEENPTLGKRQQLHDEEPQISRKEFASVLSQVRQLEHQLRKMAQKIEVLEEKDRIHTEKERETALALTKVALKEDLYNQQKLAVEKSPAVSIKQLQPVSRELRPLDPNSVSSTLPLELPAFRYPAGGQSVPNKTGANPLQQVTDPHDLINQIKSQLRKTKPAQEALEESRSLYKKMKGLQLPSFQANALDSLQQGSLNTGNSANLLSLERASAENKPTSDQKS